MLLARNLTDKSGIELLEWVGGRLYHDAFSPAVATRKIMRGERN